MINKRGLGTMLVALMAVSVVAAPMVSANGRPLQAQLSGANEVPGPGDEDGTGVARLRLNQGRHRVCYMIGVTDVAAPTAAHIHAGEAGVAGPVVVDLEAVFEDGVAKGCVTGVERSLIKQIRKHRADYYVNVHNEEFVDGAVRGQLSKWAPGRDKRAH